MKLSTKEFKDLLKSNLSERIYQRCKTCDRIKVESELQFLLDHPQAALPVKGLDYKTTISAIKKGIAAHDSFIENASKQKHVALMLIKSNPNQLRAEL